MATKKTYTGSCHCGRIKFEIEADIDAVRVCNCSVCAKRGALIFRVENDSFRLNSSIAQLSTYEWNTNTAKDYFCTNCGILPFRKPRALTQDEIDQGMKPFNGWSVNVRCLDGFDFSKVPVVSIDGKGLD